MEVQNIPTAYSPDSSYTGAAYNVSSGGIVYDYSYNYVYDSYGIF